ncbi:MAG: hypothetical protein JSV80_07805 [Acidobacteriota bacterium]|nr:MAG: hypothetical protein JSV80_07805 [Acidobacteriota bacterium]
MYRFCSILAVMVLAGWWLGCSGEPQEKTLSEAAEDLTEAASEAAADLGDAAEDLVEKAGEMAAADVEQAVAKYKKQITEKEQQLEDLLGKIKGMSPQDLTGDDGRQLQEQSEKLKSDIAALKEKMQPLLDKLAAAE